MNHALQIKVTKQPREPGVVAFRNIAIRERLLRLLLGNKAKLTVIILGNANESGTVSEAARILSKPVPSYSLQRSMAGNRLVKTAVWVGMTLSNTTVMTGLPALLRLRRGIQFRT